MHTRQLMGYALQMSLPVSKTFHACMIRAYLRVQVIEQDSGQVALPKAGQDHHYQLALVLHPLC